MSARGGDALAFGSQGHRITGLIAYALLDSAVKAKVDSLLQSSDMESLASAATWMDEHRGELGDTVAEWHFDDVPVCGNASHAQYCKEGNCASGQLPRLIAVLKDKSASFWDRQEAFLMVVHMVGDINQPLHAADNDDRGGNGVMVTYRGSDGEKKLHSAWDTLFLTADMKKKLGEKAFAKALLKAHHDEVVDLQAGTIDDWIASSHEIAVNQAYGDLPHFACGAESGDTVKLPKSYVDDATETVETQLVAGGARIAKVLNEAFAD
jgi:hypothetical protein